MNDLAPPLLAIARAASREILAVKAAGPAVREKADRSPVTDADIAANALVTAALAELTPDIPVIAEESDPQEVPAPGSRFWLVDPLDGTREFIAGRDEYTVNIALIENRRPLLGVVGIPERDEVYLGTLGAGAERIAGDGGRRAIAARMPPPEGLVALASRSHGSPETDAWLARPEIAEVVRIGSALKFCLLAEGRADIYPRLGRTMEWDTAAGHAVLAAAGGSLTTLDGGAFLYAKPGFENPPFLARGRVAGG